MTTVAQEASPPTDRHRWWRQVRLGIVIALLAIGIYAKVGEVRTDPHGTVVRMDDSTVVIVGKQAHRVSLIAELSSQTSHRTVTEVCNGATEDLALSADELLRPALAFAVDDEEVCVAEHSSLAVHGVVLTVVEVGLRSDDAMERLHEVTVAPDVSIWDKLFFNTAGLMVALAVGIISTYLVDRLIEP